MHIGIAGTGRMGTAVALRLQSQGHAITVWNRSQGRARPLLDAGMAWAATPRALAESTDLVLSLLTDEAALDAVYLEPEGLLAGDAAGRTLIDMSTVSPAKPPELARRAAAVGATYLECPVGGSVGPAREGRLLGLVGGDAADVARVEGVLMQLCRRLEHVGPHGAGATMKLAINLPLMVYWQTLGEALSLVQPLGLAPERVVDILADSSGGPNMLKVRGPMIARALAGATDGPVTVDLATMRKDMQMMLALAAGHGWRLPLAERTMASIEAASRDGLAQADCARLPVWWLDTGGRTSG